jgi:hypothetical protein
MKLTHNQLFAGVVSAAVLVVVIAGLIVAGSPNQERMRRADQERVNDLQMISSSIQGYMYDNSVLPESLVELARSPNVYLQRVNDPETGAPYIYTPGVDGHYQLCATFETDSDSGPDQPAIPQPTGFWAHGVGERCFALEAKPDENTLKPLPMPVRQ